MLKIRKEIPDPQEQFEHLVNQFNNALGNRKLIVLSSIAVSLIALQEELRLIKAELSK